MAKSKRRKKFRKLILIWLLANAAAIIGYIFYISNNDRKILEKEGAEMELIKGENKEITGNDYDRSLAVVCDNGTFVGKEKNDVRSYRGIPFAEAPIGELRWKPPVDAKEDDGVYEAYYYGKSGIQTEAASERASLYTQGEDCLTLNVFCSEENFEESEPKAVMVFFPGGAYGWGGTADPLYDGQNFLEAHSDIVLVTVNYRIGVMGFIDLSEVPGGEDYKESGNLGLLDQVSALRWVQRNIKAFGGDPDNVTIFGESAGGSSVSLLPLMDEAEGLFRRAIAESGSIAFTYSTEESKLQTRKFMDQVKASSMKDLLALSEEEIMKVNEKLNDYNNFPVRDGIILPEDLYAAYAEGKGSDIDMLSGTNMDEARYWIEEVGGYPVYRWAARLIYGSVTDDMDYSDRRYANAFTALVDGSDIWKKTEFINDLVFRVPAIRQAELHTKNGGKDYMYYWTKESAIPFYGACHAVELAYVFNNLDDTIYTGERADETLAKTVQEMWVNFAKTGDPSTDTYHWTAYDPAERQTMYLGDEVKLVSDPLEEQRVLIEPLLKYRYNGYYGILADCLGYLRKRFLEILALIAGANVLIGGFIYLRSKEIIKKQA